MRCLGISDVAHRFCAWHNVSPRQLKESLYSVWLKEATSVFDPVGRVRPYLAKVDNSDPLTMVWYADLKMAVPDELLLKIDKVGMGTRLQLPFLDDSIVRFACSVPSNLKVRGLVGKYVFRKAVGNMLPRSLLPGKGLDFLPAIRYWFRKELGGYVTEVLLGDKTRSRGYFVPAQVEELLRLHKEGKDDFSRPIFALVCLELWHRIYIDRSTG